jgi:natural product biosynthesis luciferase-like monooxygenase protein
MMTATSFSCFLIGSDTLLAQCGEILLARGHSVRGVITDGARIVEWAESHSISTIPAGGDYSAVLQSSKFDYLFAITHLALIPDRAVRSPSRLAINFHDGPLPAYAGLNAPMWALLHGEQNYGISWHVVGSGIDDGDLLLQQPVAITDEDTALSLNTKCFAAALESFPVLVDQLAAGRQQRQPQPSRGRSYFSRFQKPPGACVLNWRKSASELEQQVRALNVGRYANPVGSAKLLLGDEALIVEAAGATTGNGGTPGRIASIDDSTFTIETGDGLLAIRSLASLDGTPVAIADLRSRFAARQSVETLSEGDLDRLSALAGECARHEPFWCERLSGVEAIDLPYRRPTGAAGGGRASVEIVPPSSFDTAARAMPFAMVGAFLQFIGRALGVTRFDVAVSGPAMEAGIEFSGLFSTHGFVNVDLDAAAPAWNQSQKLVADAQNVLNRGPWLRDLIARQPTLRARPALRSDAKLPVAVVFGDLAAGPDVAEAELVLTVTASGATRLAYSTTVYSPDSIAQLCAHFKAVLEAMGSAPRIAFRELDLVDEAERALVVEKWNATDLDYDSAELIHRAFEKQAGKTPEAAAIAFEDREITYRALDERSSLLAARLRAMGIGPDQLVGVHVSRSIELMVATLAVLKAGGAYVPLDPAFPADRLQFMIADSAMRVIITQAALRGMLPADGPTLITVDGGGDASGAAIERAPAEPPTDSTHLAYVIYTSGSTGRPKGVMIEHRNVANFFAAMDRKIPRDRGRPLVWLAVTSLSFDISVLELLWTLTRGFKVVIHDEARIKAAVATQAADPGMSRSLGLGLFMWGNDDAPGPAKYRLLIEGAKYFDDNGFAAVWTPERHFHAFGGPYPNPAVTGAAVAAVTRNVKIRAGSCVVPLHHPIRIAEEWAVVDNLSNGRVEIASASGWNPNDFVLSPANHANSKQVMFSQLDQVRRLWRGEKLAFPGPFGKDVEIQSLPRPVQSELPCWITTAGNPETWRDAGARGFHVLTHLLGQTVAEVGEKIRIYRDARAAAGFDPAAGQVALMLHTLVGDDDDSVRELVRKPMKSYLASSMRLAMDFAWSFPAFKRPGGQDTRPEDVDIKKLSAEEIDTILDFAFERYFSTSGLFGTVDTCFEMLSKCADIGVSEIACLLDFGVDTDVVMQSLPRLKELKERADASARRDSAQRPADFSFAGMVRGQGVTHMQCTPSMARLYLADAEARAAIGTIPHILLGGEALPLALVRELTAQRKGTLTNMYGPTETTIWSMTHSVETPEAEIPIGRPIANTRIYVLDKFRRPVPIGVLGELFIGGDGVARGYLNRPELTAERFVADPFSRAAGARMYATGDLAKFRPNGDIEFIGRADFQVKVRGYRIELGEIETLLEAQTGVRQAAVVVRAEDAADLRLVAYVVGDTGASLRTADLRAALRTKLPDYMVPSEILILPDMPRTANGKLDRKALQVLKSEPVRQASPDAAPQGEVEKTIADLWRKTLKLERVGVNDNFFDLGGHSLLVVQLHGQLKQALSSPLSLTDLYQYPTIRSLSEYLSSGRAGVASQQGASRGARRRALRSRSV